MDSEPGDVVWVPWEEESVLWLPAVVKERRGDELLVLVAPSLNGRLPRDSGKEESVVQSITLSARSVLPAKADACSGVDDLLHLSEFTEPALVNSLRVRYASERIYTSVGPILVVVNPFKELPGMYDSSQVEKVLKSSISGERLPSHIFSVGALAYRSMLETRRSQSILISGESGAGKTEATKQILKFLMRASSPEGDPEGTLAASPIEQRIIDSNPLLEAFGNAQTAQNNNSSRFGKFIDVRFDNKCRVVGAHITSYLLEKSRVVHFADGERNFHIFYYLCGGLSPELKEELGLGDAQSYKYLMRGNLPPGMDLVAQFQKVKRALDVCGVTLNLQTHIWKVLAAILHIGNVRFRPGTSSGSEAAVIVEMAPVNRAARLLACDSNDLGLSMTTRKISRAGKNVSVYVKHLDVRQAETARDGLAKALYSDVFSTILERINDSMSTEGASSIGILDIFGFEVFKTNRFEQMCINYANESLQSFFHELLFELEKEIYRKEGVDAGLFEMADNLGVLRVFEDKPNGIFSLLDEECKLPKGSEALLLQKIQEAHNQSAAFVRVRQSTTQFGVRHFAGDVMYVIDDMLQKNRDELPKGLGFLHYSRSPFVRASYGRFMGIEGPIARPKERALLEEVVVAQQKPTVSKAFGLSLKTLMTLLHSTEPHFVRCLKPNRSQRPDAFHSSEVLRQVSYTGLLETVKSRAAGYPVRMSFVEAWNRFRVLGMMGGSYTMNPEMRAMIMRPVSTETPLYEFKSSLDSILRSASMMSTRASSQHRPYALGKTMTFMTDDFAVSLHRAVTRALTPSVVVLQKHVRGKIARERVKQMMEEKRRREEAEMQRQKEEEERIRLEEAEMQRQKEEEERIRLEEAEMQRQKEEEERIRLEEAEMQRQKEEEERIRLEEAEMQRQKEEEERIRLEEAERQLAKEKEHVKGGHGPERHEEVKKKDHEPSAVRRREDRDHRKKGAERRHTKGVERKGRKEDGRREREGLSQRPLDERTLRQEQDSADRAQREEDESLRKGVEERLREEEEERLVREEEMLWGGVRFPSVGRDESSYSIGAPPPPYLPPNPDLPPTPGPLSPSVIVPQLAGDETCADPEDQRTWNRIAEIDQQLAGSPRGPLPEWLVSEGAPGIRASPSEEELSDAVSSLKLLSCYRGLTKASTRVFEMTQSPSVDDLRLAIHELKQLPKVHRKMAGVSRDEADGLVRDLWNK